MPLSEPCHGSEASRLCCSLGCSGSGSLFVLLCRHALDGGFKAVKVAQQDGEKEVEDNKVAQDHKQDKVHYGANANSPPTVIHDLMNAAVVTKS